MRRFLALLILLGLALPGFCQNFTIEIIPLSATVLPDTGGTISYRVIVTNQGSMPQSADVWGVSTRPNGTNGRTQGPTTMTLLAGQSQTWDRQEVLPATAPEGYYTIQAKVGLYPNTVWTQTHFDFQKQMITGGVEQVWSAFYNGSGNLGDAASSIVLDSEGNIYVAGHSYGNGTYSDYVTIKYNTAGIQQWVALYNGSMNYTDEARCLALDPDGNIYVTGDSWGTGTVSDYVTIKYNSNGVQQWLARYNGPGNGWDVAECVALDADGNVYVTGKSDGIELDHDYATIKYDNSGIQQWVVRYDGPGNSNDEAIRVAVDIFGHVYVTGESYGSETGFDYTTIMYDTAGIQLWVARYDGPTHDNDLTYDLALDDDGRVFVTGGSKGSSSYEYATVKYDTAGIQQWVARYDGAASGEDRAHSLAVDASGNVYVTGRSHGSGTADDYASIKYDSFGVQQWVARYNSPINGDDNAEEIAVDAEGNVYVTGLSYGNGTYGDCATIKYNSSGLEQWVARHNGPGNYSDGGFGMAMDTDEDIFITGMSFGSGTGCDIATLKYSQSAIPNWQPVTTTYFGAPVPQECRLASPHPNPFNPSTAISYQLSAISHVSLRVYDVSGKVVAILVDGRREAGTHEITFDGSALAAGVYFVMLQAGEFSAAQKLVLLK
jgi:uncharacterized delta-60 repeat protein